MKSIVLIAPAENGWIVNFNPGGDAGFPPENTKRFICKTPKEICKLLPNLLIEVRLDESHSGENAALKTR